MGPDTQVERLVLDGFDVGLSAEGFGTMVARDVSAIGGFVGFSASHGAELLVNGIDAINLAANASAHNGGLIDGFVEDIALHDLDNLTLYSGPPGAEDFTVLEGWTEPDGATNLFVRHAQTRPLREVTDLVADTSPYDLYSILGFGQSDQRWPRHVYDGIDGDFFRWAFKDAAAYEWIHVMGQRPIRTDKFVLHHLQVDSKLFKYSFSLLGRGRTVIETFEVETDATVDEIAIDPEIDFFGFRIDVVEAIGTSPGFTEIEADVLDSDAYAPLSVSRRRAIFPRPHRGERGVIEINGDLRPIGEAVFTDQTPVSYTQSDNTYRSTEPITRTLAQSATTQDFRAALDAIADAGAGEIVIPGTLDIDASLAEITMEGLRLTGGGEIRSTDGSGLVFRDSRDIRIDNLTLTGGGIELRNTYPFVLEAATITQFDTAIIADQSRVVVTNSSISGGNLAYQGDQTALTMTGSLIEDVAIGLSARTADPLVLVGNTISARESAVDLRQESHNLGILALIANDAEPGIPTTPVTAEYNLSTSSLFGDNVLANLGLTGDMYSVDIKMDWLGNGIHDIRLGVAPTQVRLLEIPDPDTRCLLSTDTTLPDAPRPVVLQRSATIVVHDTDASLLCHNASGGAKIALPPASQPSAPIPAIARLVISLDNGFENVEDGMANSVVASIRSEPIGSAQPFPVLGAEGAADAKRRLIYSLVDAGDMAGAFSRAFDYYARSPRDRDVGKLLLYTADSWAAVLESQGLSDEALELLTDLADAETAPSGAQKLVVNAHFDRASVLTDLQHWEDARHDYRLALARDPTLDVARQNITYVYQEDLRSRFTGDTAPATIAWVDAQSLEYPEFAEGLREVAGILLGNTVIDAINNRHFDDALVLASAHLRWSPNERTINNLRVAFQDYAIDAVARQQSDAVLDKLENLTDAHGTGPDLAGILANVFNNVAITAVEEGDFASAKAAARVIYGANPTANAAELLAYTYGRQAQAIEAAGDATGATQLLIDALEIYPDFAGLAEQGRSTGNSAGLAASDAGDQRAAVDTLQSAISISWQQRHAIAEFADHLRKLGGRIGKCRQSGTGAECS